MVVDFEIKTVRAFRVAALRWTGPWSDARIHREFGRIMAWARIRGLRTGVWIFREPAARTWEVAVEIRGAARSERPVRVKTYPAATVARVVYDPKVVSAPLVYHALADWLRWRRRDRTIRSVGGYREIYPGDPWKDPRALARTDVQFVVRRGRPKG